MAKQEQGLNIYKKLANMRKQVEVYKKTKSGFGYTYTPEDEILAKITVQLEKQGLLCMPSIVPGTFKVEPYEYVKTKVDKKTSTIYEEKNAEVIVSAEMRFTWVDIETQESIVIPWTIVGMQADASQAFGSALTYCTRYYYLKFFNASTVDDDPDNWRSKQKEAELAEDKGIAAEIVNTIDELSREYVSKADDPDKARKEITDIIKKYEKSGNYKKIDKSVVAASLLKELQDTLNIGN